MRNFDLYVSGILYGRLRLGDGTPQIRKLDVHTGALLDWQDLTEQDRDFYRFFVKMDFAALGQNLSHYESGLHGTGEVSLCGERYTSEDGCSYLQRDVKFPNNKQMKEGRLIAVTCPAREMVTVLVEPGAEEETILRLWRSTWPEEQLFPVQHAQTFPVPMRDGVHLSTDVYLPKNCSTPVPAVLVRTPYGKEDGCEVYYRYVQRGYAVVVQDVRGRNASEGEWLPNYHEVEDGDDTLNWIAAQPWCSGRIGMVGGSYLGYVQWAAAASGNPHLKALISVVCAGSSFVDLPRRGGSFTSGMLAWAFAVSQKTFHPELMERDDWEKVLNIRPLTDLPKKALGYDVPFITRWLEPSDYNDFWRMSNWQERSVGAQIPALIQSGWFDDNGMGTTEALELVHDFPRGMRKVILGPWQHSGNSRYDLHALSFPAGALRFDLDLLYQKWFDHFLRGEENGVEQSAPVEYYTMGENRWKTASRWPVENADDTPFYFGENGTLFPICGREGRTGYTYDPQDPGTHIIDMSENEIAVPEDYTQEEQRPDYICYTTPTLPAPLTVTGDARVTLYVSSDAPDTDFMVRLCDVDEAGRSVKLADGILAARFRNGFSAPEYLEPGKVEKLVIRTSKISHCFLPGHRLRVSVTSGAKHFVFPNSNTKDAYNSTESRVAHNTVWHGGAAPSHILLHVER